jgi:uncharacterized FlaG/YvyC family protein
VKPPEDHTSTGVLRLRQAVAPLDRFLRGVSRALEIRRDAGTGAFVVAVRDLTTGEVLRQSPQPETAHQDDSSPGPRGR